MRPPIDYVWEDVASQVRNLRVHYLYHFTLICNSELTNRTTFY